MTDSKPLTRQQTMAELAPETYNDEQHDAPQAQQIALEAEALTQEVRSPTESDKPHVANNLFESSMQDTVDHMRDMESSGRIDMDAFAGEPNHDDNTGKYGKGHKA